MDKIQPRNEEAMLAMELASGIGTPHWRVSPPIESHVMDSTKEYNGKYE